MLRCLSVIAVLMLAGCSESVPPSLPTTLGQTGSDFPIGTTSLRPFEYPTVESPGVINLLSTIIPSAVTGTTGCPGCGNMTMNVSGASYPGYGSTFNGNYTFTRVGGSTNGCVFEAQSAGTWRWVLQPCSQYGGWELIGQMHSGACVIYVASGDPSNSGSNWTSANFSLVFSNTPTGVPQSLTVN